MTRQFIYKLLHMGPAGLARSAAGRLRLLRFKWARRAYLRAAEAAGGLEVGGPSLIFMPDGIMPVYQRLRSLDGANFSRETVWGSSGGTYEYLPGRNTGRHFVCEASDMRAIPSGSYDIVLASHVLEHVANPLKALEEWKRLLRRGGHLLMVLPERSLTFDHRRPVTSLDHLLADRDGGTGEDDLTHLDEILRLHDLERPACGPDGEVPRTLTGQRRQPLPAPSRVRRRPRCGRLLRCRAAGGPRGCIRHEHLHAGRKGLGPAQSAYSELHS